MAATGGRVLALRSVEFARNHHVQIHVRSSFTWAPGTWVTEEDPSLSMEQAIISGVTHDASEAKITIEQVPDRPGVAATWFRALADAGVNVDMIVQNVSTAGHTDISFTVPRADLARAESVMEKIVVDTEARGYRTDARHRPDLAHRCGHEDASRHRGQDVRDDGRRGHQHRDDQHLDDPDLVRGRGRRRGARRCGRCTRRSDSTERTDVSPRPVSVGLMGATGLVGTEMLRILDERVVSRFRAARRTRRRARSGRKLPFAGGEVDVRGPGARAASTGSTS